MFLQADTHATRSIGRIGLNPVVGLVLVNHWEADKLPILNLLDIPPTTSDLRREVPKAAIIQLTENSELTRAAKLVFLARNRSLEIF